MDGGAIAAFVEALESWPRGSAHHKMSELDDVICDQILSRLWVQPQPASFTFPDTFAMDGDRRWTASRPNRPAAIALSNCAQALLLAGQPKRALRNAQRAAKADPSYVKGHFRWQRGARGARTGRSG